MKPIRFVVTAGPTREYLDPVRFLSNPSTGRMGFAVARAARCVVEDVVLIAGPVNLCTPKGVRRVDVVNAREMCEAVLKEVFAPAGEAVCTCLMMTAAVADWRPVACAPCKLKKEAMASTLRLMRNPDILLAVKAQQARTPRALVRVGFAAETGAPIREAQRKCREKELDMIVANDVTLPGCGFGTSTNRVTCIYPDGRMSALPLLTKAALARRLIHLVGR